MESSCTCSCVNCKCINCQCSDVLYDVIVVGAGIMGSATAYHLAKQRKKILLLEQFPLPHTRGSSHGPTRIIRTAYLESYNARIIPAAMDMWKILEQETSTSLISDFGVAFPYCTKFTGQRKTGMLVFSSTSPDVVENYRSNITPTAGVTTALMSYQQLKDTFPSISFTSTDVGCLDTHAGTLYADKCLQALQKVFTEKGGLISDNQRVVEIIPGDIVIIKTDTKIYKARGVVLTCGPWTCSLLSKLGVILPLRCEAAQVCYWRNKPGCEHDNFSLKHIFLNYEVDFSIYGLPMCEYPDLVKIAARGGVTCDPDRRDQVDPKQEAERLIKVKEFIIKRFPSLTPEPAIKERCLYTVTPDKECVIDCHPTSKNIVYATGFSGHGFKMAPVIGSMIADLVEQKKPKYYVKEFSADRFLYKSQL